MKRPVSLMMTLAMLLSIFACGTTAFGESAAPAPAIQAKEMTFYLCDVNDTRTLPVYFIGDSDVP